MMKRRWHVIINPNAGNKTISRDWPRIKTLLENANLDFGYTFTTQPLQAIELTRQAIENGERNFIAVGGDGTFNEVANGIFLHGKINTEECLLAAIPVGTGNDWGRMYGIPADYQKAVELIVNEKFFVQDVGIVNYFNDGKRKKRYFINIAGLGFDALVAYKTNKQKETGKVSAFSYFFNMLTGLFQYKPGPMRIEIDGDKHEFNVFSITVGICRYNGGGMMQSPLAVPDDGLLDVTVIKKIGMGTLAMQLKNLYNGTFIQHPKVLTFRGSSIKIIPVENIFRLESDGENLGLGPFEFSVLPRALKVVIGEKNF